MLAAAEPRRLRRWIRRKRLVLQDDDTAPPCHHMRRRLVVDNPKGIAGATFLGLEIARIDTIFMVSFLRGVWEACVCVPRGSQPNGGTNVRVIPEQLFLKRDTRESRPEEAFVSFRPEG